MGLFHFRVKFLQMLESARANSSLLVTVYVNESVPAYLPQLVTLTEYINEPVPAHSPQLVTAPLTVSVTACAFQLNTVPITEPVTAQSSQPVSTPLGQEGRASGKQLRSTKRVLASTNQDEVELSRHKIASSRTK